MKEKIFVPDMSCESCSRLIGKRFKGIHGIGDFTFDDESVVLDYDPARVKKDMLIDTIKEAGFRASFLPFEGKTFSERWRDFNENRKKYAIEWAVLKNTVLLFIMLYVIEAIAYFAFFFSIPDFMARYGWWIFYFNVSISTLAAAAWHYFAYKGKVTCMTGMMVGMTIGMQAGMMLGAVFGATNGFFVGSMVGMLIGVGVGALAGQGCGVMGWMQGMMAGLMGGTMGPMISVMMFSDHLLVFMPFYIIINVLILWGFSYMVYEEIVEGKEVVRKPLDFTGLASLTTLIGAVLLIIMVYGPKSILLG
jgi:copper chaperone CopZ